MSTKLFKKAHLEVFEPDTKEEFEDFATAVCQQIKRLSLTESGDERSPPRDDFMQDLVMQLCAELDVDAVTAVHAAVATLSNDALTLFRKEQGKDKKKNAKGRAYANLDGDGFDEEYYEEPPPPEPAAAAPAAKVKAPAPVPVSQAGSGESQSLASKFKIQTDDPQPQQQEQKSNDISAYFPKPAAKKKGGKGKGKNNKVDNATLLAQLAAQKGETLVSKEEEEAAEIAAAKEAALRAANRHAKKETKLLEKKARLAEGED